MPIQRHLGKSEFVCLAPGTGEQIVGSLLSALRWFSQQQGWFEFSYITKVRHKMIRPQEYSNLLWTVSQCHQLSDNFIVENYLVEDIWQMWNISARHLDLHVHNLTRNSSKGYYYEKDSLSPQIVRLLPESPVVPSTANTK